MLPQRSGSESVVCDLASLNSPGGSAIVVGGLAYSATERLLYFATPSTIYTCAADGDEGQLPLMVRPLVFGPQNRTSSTPGAMVITGGSEPELALLWFGSYRPTLLRIAVAELGSDAPFRELVAAADTDAATTLAAHTGSVIWSGANAVWQVALAGEGAAPTKILDKPARPVLAIAVSDDTLWMVSAAGIAACSLAESSVDSGDCIPRTLLSPWSTALRWMALDAENCVLYHSDGKSAGRRKLGDWNASKPLAAVGTPFESLKNPVGPAVCGSGSGGQGDRELYLAAGGSGSFPAGVAPIPAGIVAIPAELDGDPQKPARVLVSSDGMSPSNFIVAGSSQGKLAKDLFFASNGDLYRSDLDGGNRKIISYKAASGTNATLVRFGVRAIALDNKHGVVYASAAYSDRAMVFAMGPDGKSGAIQCYYR